MNSDCCCVQLFKCFTREMIESEKNVRVTPVDSNNRINGVVSHNIGHTKFVSELEKSSYKLKFSPGFAVTKNYNFSDHNNRDIINEI